MMKIYFARPISAYGNLQDVRDIQHLCILGEVINPNEDNTQKKYKETGFAVFYKLIDSCNILAFRRALNGKITRGVWDEILYAQELNLPIIELPSIYEFDVMSIEDTKTYLKQIGQR